MGRTGGHPQINLVPLQLGQGPHGDLDVEVCPCAADVHGHNYWGRKQDMGEALLAFPQLCHLQRPLQLSREPPPLSP